MTLFKSKTTNTILYCQNWPACVEFYRRVFAFPETTRKSWFIEFQMSETAYLSLADHNRTSIKSGQGAGLTLTFQVEDADAVWHEFRRQGIPVEEIKTHSWGARTFFLFDPEGNRLEIWSEI